MDDILDYILTASLMLAGGIMKGVVGIGLPAFLIGTMSLFLEPRDVILIILFPIMLTNIRQGLIGEPLADVFVRYRILALVSAIVIFGVAFFAGQVPTNILLIVVGAAVTFFGVSSLLGGVPRLPDAYVSVGQTVTGIVSGILGGLTAIWGPPIAMYLMARDVSKAEFVQVTGMLFSVGAIFMGLGVFIAGEMTWRSAFQSALMLPIVFGGMFIGEAIRDRLNRDLFYKLVLIGFFLIGLNLIRKGIFG
ncbi:MAG: sulfite exporter TauE/SafE family protein [Pseudomonadota bacterium]